jgi:hypothetical protein
MSEKGHAVIVANFETLIVFVVSLGALYQPSNPLLQIDALQILLVAAQNAMSVARDKRTAKKNAVNICQAKFALLKPLSTRIINLFAACGADKLAIASLRYYVRKIHGKRVSPRIVDNPETPDVDESRQSRSSAQTSRSSLLEHFERIVQFLFASDFYVPNEADMKPESLNAFAAELRAVFYALIEANVENNGAIGDRNQLLYLSEACLIKRASLIKTYLKTIPELKATGFGIINNLTFDKPPRI